MNCERLILAVERTNVHNDDECDLLGHTGYNLAYVILTRLELPEPQESA